MIKDPAVVEEIVQPVLPAVRGALAVDVRHSAPSWTLPLFAAGLVIGLVLAAGTAPGRRENPYPSLPSAAEPEAGASLAAVLTAEDTRALGRFLSAEQLKSLGEAMQPVVTVFEVKFTGAVERNGEVLAAYIVQGRDRSGSDAAVGFVLHVQAGKVVGVN